MASRVQYLSPNGRQIEIPTNTSKFHNHNKIFSNKINKEGMGPQAMLKRKRELAKMSVQNVSLADKISAMEEDNNTIEHKMFFLQQQVRKDEVYARQRDQAKLTSEILQDRANRAKMEASFFNYKTKIENLTSKFGFTQPPQPQPQPQRSPPQPQRAPPQPVPPQPQRAPPQPVPPQPQRAMVFQSSAPSYQRDPRDLSPPRRSYVDIETKEATKEEMDEEEYYADQLNAIEEAEFGGDTTTSLPEEWPELEPVEEPEQPQNVPMEEPEESIPELIPIEPEMPMVVSAIEPLDQKNEEPTATAVSPVSSELNLALNNLNVDEEVKVILTKTCKFCPKPLSRADVCVLECGHCLHFFCAYRYYQATYIEDGLEKMGKQCLVCGKVQKKPPPNLSESLKIIGNDLLDEVFGKKPRSPLLTLLKN